MAICYSSGYVYCFSKQLNDNILAGAQPPFVYALLPRVYLNDSKGNHQGGPFNAFLCILFFVSYFRYSNAVLISSHTFSLHKSDDV